MKFVCFTHSFISDWNHGNAHFLRGVVGELLLRGHEVQVFEPESSWSFQNLLRDHGQPALAAFHAAYPKLSSRRYGAHLDLDEALAGADVVIAHEWNEPRLIARIGEHHARGGRYALLFHDTHHRAVTAPDEIARLDLRHYDGVLAFGRVVRDQYRDRGWAARAWTWHQAVDVRLFTPQPAAREGDLVWLGNWGDGERAADLQEMVIEPVAALGLRARIHGVRYPDDARVALAYAGITYAGWLPNFAAPAVYARHAVTVNVPERAYVEALRGVPACGLFEALACGIPVVSAPWRDDEGLFTAGEDYLIARDSAEMRRQLRDVLGDRGFATELAEHGRATILARHTCAHRVDELFAILTELDRSASLPTPEVPS